MSVKIRLSRLGRRHRPFYRMAAVESRNARNGRVIEELGFYDPLAKDEESGLKVNTERAEYWLSVGAQPSDTCRSLLRKSGVTVKPRRIGSSEKK